LKRFLHLLSFVITSFFPLIKNITWKPNLIFLVAPSILFAPSTIFLKFLLGKRIKTWIHIQDFEVDAAFQLRILKGFFLKKIFLYIEKIIISQFEIISTIGIDMLSKAKQKGLDKEKLFLFPNWIDFEFVDHEKNIQNVRNKKNFFKEMFKGKIVLMYSGSMNKKQNFDLIIKCIRKLGNYNNILWVISGEGSSKKHFVNEVKNYKNVRVFDLQPDYFLQTWLKLADIHLLPQKKGINNLVLPSKIIGILASGKPVIATTPKLSELGNYVSEAGICIETNELKNFIKAIKKLSQNKLLREKLGKNGYNLSRNKFDKRIVLTNMRDHINKLIGF